MVLLVAFFASVNGVKAQSFQKFIDVKVNGEIAWCLNRPIVAEIVYKVTYHVSPVTGKLTSMMVNSMGGKVYDAETGERYVFIDNTSKDNLGSWWDFMNNVNYYNGGDDYEFWSVPNGWLDAYMPDELPGEGSTVYSVLRIIGKDVHVSMHILTQFHMNANGEITANVYREKIDCN